MMSNLIGRRTLETEKKTRGIELRILENTEIEDSEIQFCYDTMLEFVHVTGFINGVIRLEMKKRESYLNMH